MRERFAQVFRQGIVIWVLKSFIIYALLHNYMFPLYSNCVILTTFTHFWEEKNKTRKWLHEYPKNKCVERERDHIMLI